MKKVLNFLIGLCLLIALICMVLLGRYFLLMEKSKEDFKDLKKYVPAIEDRITDKNAKKKNSPAGEQNLFSGLLALKKKNKDFAGWLTIADTKIEYPVMFTPLEPEYYLKRSFSKKNSIAGTPFIDGRCKLFPQSDNLIIYGHNMKNGSMFGDLLSYTEEEFYQTHPKIRFFLPGEEQEYEIFAVIKTKVYPTPKFNCYSMIQAENEEDFNSYIQEIKKCALYETGITPKYKEKLITLSTCAYHDVYGRLLVMGRRRPC
ncbi:MAG: class B sortase [Acetivibrio sp.]